MQRVQPGDKIALDPVEFKREMATSVFGATHAFATALDVGCGEGYLARELVNRGARHVDGIDKSAALIAAARSAEIPAASFSGGDAADLPFSPESFDLVLANHLLNNLRDIKLPIGEFARVLRPSGRLIALIRHPCFYGYRRTLAWTDYFSQRAIEHPFRVDGLTFPCHCCHMAPAT